MSEPIVRRTTRGDVSYETTRKAAARAAVRRNFTPIGGQIMRAAERAARLAERRLRGEVERRLQTKAAGPSRPEDIVPFLHALDDRYVAAIVEAVPEARGWFQSSGLDDYLELGHGAVLPPKAEFEANLDNFIQLVADTVHNTWAGIEEFLRRGLTAEERQGVKQAEGILKEGLDTLKAAIAGMDWGDDVIMRPKSAQGLETRAAGSKEREALVRDFVAWRKEYLAAWRRMWDGAGESDEVYDALEAVVVPDEGPLADGGFAADFAADLATHGDLDAFHSAIADVMARVKRGVGRVKNSEAKALLEEFIATVDVEDLAMIIDQFGDESYGNDYDYALRSAQGLATRAAGSKEREALVRDFVAWRKAYLAAWKRLWDEAGASDETYDAVEALVASDEGPLADGGFDADFAAGAGVRELLDDARPDDLDAFHSAIADMMARVKQGVRRVRNPEAKALIEEFIASVDVQDLAMIIDQFGDESSENSDD